MNISLCERVFFQFLQYFWWTETEINPNRVEEMYPYPCFSTANVINCIKWFSTIMRCITTVCV